MKKMIVAALALGLAGCAQTTSKMAVPENAGGDPTVTVAASGSAAIYSHEAVISRAEEAANRLCQPYTALVSELAELKEDREQLLEALNEVVKNPEIAEPPNLQGLGLSPERFMWRQMSVPGPDITLIEKIDQGVGDAKKVAEAFGGLLETVTGWFPEHSVEISYVCGK